MDHNTPKMPSLLYRAMIAVTVCVGLFLVYVLSIGPAVWLSNRGYLAKETSAVYFPLFWLCEAFPWLKLLLQRYVDLWTLLGR